jgi:hypothetical protein
MIIWDGEGQSRRHLTIHSQERGAIVTHHLAIPFHRTRRGKDRAHEPRKETSDAGVGDRAQRSVVGPAISRETMTAEIEAGVAIMIKLAMLGEDGQ